MASPAKNMDWMNQPVLNLYPQAYLDLAQERGFDANELLKLADLNFQPSPLRYAELNVSEFERLIRAVVITLGDEHLGLDLGWRLPPTAYGSFGYALLCCRDLNQVLDLCQRFWHLIARGVHLNVEQSDDWCTAHFTARSDIQEPFRRIMLEATVTCIRRGIDLLLGHSQVAIDPEDMEIWLDYPQPESAAPYRDKLGQVRFGMPSCLLRLRTNVMKLPMQMYNPTGLAFAVKQCEQEETLANLTPDQATTRVKEALRQSSEGYPTLEQLADMQNLTVRTLRRRLQQEGSGYKELLEEARRSDAIRLLANRELEIQKIAALLGYNDPANFTRAFRQWTGQTPSQYRITRDT